MSKPDLEAYTEAVSLLLPIAQSDTTGGRVAAQVLLSTYNGAHYQLDATDLCLIDYDLLGAAVTVLAQRALTRREPHELRPEFDQGFTRVAEVWRFLHVAERYKRFY